MRRVTNRAVLAGLFIGLSAAASAISQTSVSDAVPPTQIKHVLVIGQTKGYEHDSVSAAMVAIFELGRASGLWDAVLRTDVELLTKKPLEDNAKNLDYFDAIVFANTTGELSLSSDQRRDLLLAIHEDGKGFVGIHAALDANYSWPEYGEMIGGWFDDHPWMTFGAPIINEAPDFPAVRHLPRAFVKVDEIYQVKSWSRSKVNVLLSLDPTRLTYSGNSRIHRTDHDFAVAWCKAYGKGRVFYSTLGHPVEAWVDPDIRTLYFEAIKWSLGLTDGSVASHDRPMDGRH